MGKKDEKMRKHMADPSFCVWFYKDLYGRFLCWD